MNDLEFAALLVSRVCHDLVSPVGAVVNGLEVLEDETVGSELLCDVVDAALVGDQLAARRQAVRPRQLCRDTA